MAMLRYLWQHTPALTWAALGVLLIVEWIIHPLTDPKTLIPVHGRLASYHIESDHAFINRIPSRGGRDRYVLFKLDGIDGRFYNDSVTPGNVRIIFSQPGIPVSLYRVSPYSRRKINGDGEMTYGLQVNGSHLNTLATDLRWEAFIINYVVPTSGVLAILWAIVRWRMIDAGEDDPDSAEESRPYE